MNQLCVMGVGCRRTDIKVSGHEGRATSPNQTTVQKFCPTRMIRRSDARVGKWYIYHVGTRVRVCVPKC